MKTIKFLNIVSGAKGRRLKYERKRKKEDEFCFA